MVASTRPQKLNYLTYHYTYNTKSTKCIKVWWLGVGGTDAAGTDEVKTV